MNANLHNLALNELSTKSWNMDPVDVEDIDESDNELDQELFDESERIYELIDRYIGDSVRS